MVATCSCELSEIWNSLGVSFWAYLWLCLDSIECHGKTHSLWVLLFSMGILNMHSFFSVS